MATVQGARAAGFERVGRLKAGWRADVVGLSTATARATPLPDPLAHLVYSARGDDVEFTMVDGEVLVSDGALQVADADRIRQEAREVAASLDLGPARERAREVRP
jgi:guanine deaminase